MLWNESLTPSLQQKDCLCARFFICVASSAYMLFPFMQSVHISPSLSKCNFHFLKKCKLKKIEVPILDHIMHTVKNVILQSKGAPRSTLNM